MWGRPRGGSSPLIRINAGAGERRRASDGSEYELTSRLVAVDPLEQSWAMELRAKLWRDGKLLASEEHWLRSNLYFMHELRLLLERAGFSSVTVRGGYDEADPPEHDFLVFIARN